MAQRHTSILIGPEREARIERLKRRRGFEQNSVIIRQAIDLGLDVMERIEDRRDAQREAEVRAATRREGRTAVAS